MKEQVHRSPSDALNQFFAGSSFRFVQILGDQLTPKSP